MMPQGTVKSFDPTSRTGSLLDDQLREHAIDREAFVASGLMDLRLGQRVRFELEGDEDHPRVTQLDIVSM
jgi:cold shock CspA family protein